MRRSLFRDDSGVALIQTAVSMVVMMGFVAIVIDQGVMLVARGQAQNAADAGAMAGITSRLYDDAAGTGITVQAATLAAQANHVFGAAPGVVISQEAVAGACAPGAVAGTKCVRVDAYRDGTNGSTSVPTLMSGLIGVTSQRVRATATAALLPANWNSHPKPWTFVDHFIDGACGTCTAGTWDPCCDTYSTATMYKVPGAIGTVVTLQSGTSSGNSKSFEYFRLDLLNTGSNGFIDSITSNPVIAPTTTMTILPGQGPSITTAAAPLVGTIVPIWLFSPIEQAASKGTGSYSLQIVNIMGLKITSAVNHDVTGVIAALPGEIAAGGVTGGGFLQVPTLTR